MEHPNLRFEIESSAANGSISKSEVFSGQAIRIDSYQGTVKKTLPARLRIPSDTFVLVFVKQGTALIWGEADKRWFVLPPHSVTYLRGPISLLLSLARGTQDIETLTWNGQSTPFLTEWLEKLPARSNRPDPPRTMATMPYLPFFAVVMARLEEAKKGNPDLTEPMIFAVLYEMVPRLIRSKGRLGLAPVPTDIPQGIASLIQEVRQRPDLPWPLKDAAEHVGYSPFHFSRVYKSLVGYGFHEFVDRCRTEHAVDLLCMTDTSIDVVAAAAGFGTTQALRESVKEYLGLVPSELRATPDEFDLVR